MEGLFQTDSKKVFTIDETKLNDVQKNFYGLLNVTKDEISSRYLKEKYLNHFQLAFGSKQKGEIFTHEEFGMDIGNPLLNKFNEIITSLHNDDYVGGSDGKYFKEQIYDLITPNTLPSISLPGVDLYGMREWQGNQEKAFDKKDIDHLFQLNVNSITFDSLKLLQKNIMLYSYQTGYGDVDTFQFSFIREMEKVNLESEDYCEEYRRYKFQTAFYKFQKDLIQNYGFFCEKPKTLMSLNAEVIGYIVDYANDLSHEVENSLDNANQHLWKIHDRLSNTNLQKYVELHSLINSDLGYDLKSYFSIGYNSSKIDYLGGYKIFNSLSDYILEENPEREILQVVSKTFSTQLESRFREVCLNSLKNHLAFTKDKVTITDSSIYTRGRSELSGHGLTGGRLKEIIYLLTDDVTSFNVEGLGYSGPISSEYQLRFRGNDYPLKCTKTDKISITLPQEDIKKLKALYDDFMEKSQ